MKMVLLRVEIGAVVEGVYWDSKVYCGLCSARFVCV